MDLKNTKATVLCTTESKFKSWALQNGIVKLSAASKSTSKNSLYKIQQFTGLQSENRVIHKMQSEGWQLTFQRARTAISEIDLIFEKNNFVHLIEVKTLSQSWRAFQRIEQKQIHKLLQNQIYFSQVYPKKIFKAQVCWVLTNELQFVELTE